MTLDSSSPPDVDIGELIAAVHDRLASNHCLRRRLPGEGTLRLDRQLPFLCVYRRPEQGDDAGTSELVTTEAAYIVANGSEMHATALNDVCEAVVGTLQEHFGLVLLLEVWAMQGEPTAGPSVAHSAPMFEIVAPEGAPMPATVSALAAGLESIAIDGHEATVTVSQSARVAPPDMPPLLADSGRQPTSCVLLGLAVRPVYRSRSGTQLYPLVLQRLRTQLSPAIRRTVLAFAGRAPNPFATNIDALGPSTLSRKARLVDQQLCEVSETFDFVLQVTPVNADDAWCDFRNGSFANEPTFYYRPLPYDPAQLKRRLFEIPIEDIEDPTLAHLFSEKQDELDRQLSALRDLDTPNFLYDSLQLYGEPDGELVALAAAILAERRISEFADDMLGVAEVAAQAREEIEHYHSRKATFSARVEVRDDIVASLMVTQGQLLISKSIRISRRRLEPLLHHEVGTHLLTYFNGRDQPLRQFYTGLAGAEGLQEGLAVLAEHLTGGLTCSRLRTLAARVTAAVSLLAGRSFRETFHLLHDEHGLASRTAFVTTLRAFRGGGLTKDVTYLRGARDLLRYLHAGHDLEPLYMGKLALEHVPFVQELRRRGIAQAPSLLPRYWGDPRYQDRFDAVRMLGVEDLMDSAL